MPDAPYALAVSAGMLAAVNPCGFALLPTYVSLLVIGGTTDDSRNPRLRTVGRALAMTGAMTGGFVAVFATFGLVVTPLALSVERHLPWVTIVIGVMLAGLGVWLLAGREVHIPGFGLRTGTPDMSTRALVGYGVSYAIASLSCTIAPFLALATSTFRTSSLAAGVAVFVFYAVGMGLVVGAVSLGGALIGDAIAVRMRRALPYVYRAGGLLLTIAGAYVAYYGWYELRVFAGETTGDPIVAAATRIQTTLADWVRSAGPIGGVSALVVLAAVTVAARVRRARRRARPAGEAVAETAANAVLR